MLKINLSLFLSEALTAALAVLLDYRPNMGKFSFTNGTRSKKIQKFVVSMVKFNVLGGADHYCNPVTSVKKKH